MKNKLAFLFLFLSFFLGTIYAQESQVFEDQALDSASNSPANCFFDDFSSEEEPSNASYLGDTSIFALSRENGVLSVTVNHGNESIWVPMGVGFNDDNASPTFINATDNPEGTITIHNTSRDDVEIYFTFLSGAGLANSSQVGNSVSLFGGVFVAGSSTTLSFDLANGLDRKWAADAEACEDIFGGILRPGTNDCIVSESFDVSAVTGVEWTINKAASAATSWANLPLSGEEIMFDNFRI